MVDQGIPESIANAVETEELEFQSGDIVGTSYDSATGQANVTIVNDDGEKETHSHPIDFAEYQEFEASFSNPKSWKKDAKAAYKKIFKDKEATEVAPAAGTNPPA